MRGIFALVLTAAAAAGAAMLMWEGDASRPAVDGFEGGAAESAGPAEGGGESGLGVRLADDPGSGPRSPDGAAPASGAPRPGYADAIAATLRSHLRDGHVERAAAALLEAESGALSADDVRALAGRVADELVTSAASAPAAQGMRKRITARRLYSALYSCDDSSRDEREHALDACAALHRILVTGAAAPDDIVLRHRFAPGESIWKLSRGAWKNAGVTASPGFILHVNGISDARRIRAGQTLRVPRESISLLVRKSAFELTLLLGGAPYQRFAVGIGADDSTPEGVFEIATKIENPDWYYDGRRIPFGDPENVIGTRWMGFSGSVTAEGIGIHGTTDASSIGKAMSLGCIRMKRHDVETLFEWVGRGTRVDVRR